MTESIGLLILNRTINYALLVLLGIRLRFNIDADQLIYIPVDSNLGDSDVVVPVKSNFLAVTWNVTYSNFFDIFLDYIGYHILGGDCVTQAGKVISSLAQGQLTHRDDNVLYVVHCNNFLHIEFLSDLVSTKSI